MQNWMRRLLLWAPRLLGILLIAFLMLMSLDVFGMGGSFWETLGGLLVHNLPAILLLVALVLAWRWEWVGAAAFFGFGAWYLTSSRGFHWTVYLLLAGIPMLTGVLFLVAWLYRKQIRA